jgi:CheY-like chemotaxis protein
MDQSPDIIIIDDDPKITSLILSYLANFDLIADCYHNPIEGMAKVIEHKPRMVFLDLVMPEMRGDKMIAKLSEKYIFQTTSLFLLTETSLCELEYMTMMSLGFDLIINKPICESAIHESVKNIFGPGALKQLAA